MVTVLPFGPAKRHFLAWIFFLFTSCFVPQCRASNGVNVDDVATETKSQASSPPRYGTEVSWPMQRPLEKTAIMTKSQIEAYENFIDGCYKAYSQELCEENEADRIAINAAQPSQLLNMTAAGYAKVSAPTKSFRLLKAFWEEHHADHLVTERWDAADVHTNHWAAPTHTLLLDAPDGPRMKNKKRIVEEVQAVLEQWSGVPLVPTSLYGIRIYNEGAILAPHVDRIPLVISAIINVAQDVEADWILEIIGHDGVAVNITMQPGEMILYESHSILHGRPYALKGKYYANVFVHFEPLGYSAELERKRGPQKTAKEKFQEAFAKYSEGDKYQKTQTFDLPHYIKEGSVEAARWRQEFVFHREELPKESPNKAHKKTTGVTNAHLLAASGDLKKLKEIAAENPALLNEADSNGWKPIHEAARSGNTKTLKFLIEEHKVDVNERTNHGEGATPLWWAEHVLPAGHDAIELLRRHGAEAIGPRAE